MRHLPGTGSRFSDDALALPFLEKCLCVAFAGAPARALKLSYLAREPGGRRMERFLNEAVVQACLEIAGNAAAREKHLAARRQAGVVAFRGEPIACKATHGACRAE